MSTWTKKTIECPFAGHCQHGAKYPANVYCLNRTRREDGLFQCHSFKEKELVTLDKLPEPDIELFPDHHYGRQ